MPTAAATPAIARSPVRVFGPGTVVALCALGLTLLGLVVLSSAGQASARGPLFHFQKQAVWFALALCAGGAAAFVNLDAVRRHTWLIGAVAVVLLVLVLVPQIGVAAKGARRWLDFGPMRAQPSDFGKLALVFCLAHYLAVNQRQVRTFWRGFVAPMGMVALCCGLIIVEPDFGTAALCGLVGAALIFLAGARLLYLLPTVLAGAVLFAVAVYLDPVRLKRIMSFLDIEANKSDGSFQLWQSIMGFGVGGINGAGLGEGRQQLYFLPEAHTDFVLAVVGEELGLLATAGVALAFLAIFAACLRALRRAPNLYEFTLGAGALLLLTGQALINMGVVTGLLPTKGMSLPFISYGGSNLLLMFVLTGLLLNLFRRWERPLLPAPREL